MPTITRRRLLATASAAAVVVAVTPGAAAAPSAVEPIIGLAAEAIRLGLAWNESASAYARATDAADEAGYPIEKPSAPSERDVRAIMDEIYEGWRPGGRSVPDSIRELTPKAEGIAAERHAAEMAKWQEGDERFGISAALDATDRAGDAAYAAVDAVEAETIAGAAGALAVFALGYFLIVNNDAERGAAIVAKACAAVDGAGMLGAAFPACQTSAAPRIGGDV